MAAVLASPNVQDISIAPPAGLTTPANPASGQQTQFTLFSDSWLQLQGYIAAAVNLPIGQGNFVDKYGSFDGQKVITDCIGAMQNVQACSAEFGDPKALRAALIANPQLLATDTPPNEIYSHTVWMGQRVHTTAATLVSGYEFVLQENTGLPSAQQVANLKEYLFDQEAGPIALATQMSNDIGVLIKKLGVFEAKMNQYNQQMQAFTSQGSLMLQTVDQQIGALGQKIAQLQRSRDEAWEAWKNFTIAAVTTSVGCALIGGLLAPFTGGVSLLVGGVAGLAAGIGLGVKAAACRAEYNEYCKLVESTEADQKKKQRLRGDLSGFNSAMNQAGPAMAGFLKNLQTIQGAWVQMGTDMQGIGNSVTPSNIGNSAFMVKLKSQVAVNAWKSVDDSAKQFTVGSLVDYQSIAFGDPMPEQKAA